MFPKSPSPTRCRGVIEVSQKRGKEVDSDVAEELMMKFGGINAGENLLHARKRFPCCPWYLSLIRNEKKVRDRLCRPVLSQLPENRVDNSARVD
jgi:hypothetical protein